MDNKNFDTIKNEQLENLKNEQNWLENSLKDASEKYKVKEADLGKKYILKKFNNDMSSVINTNDTYSKFDKVKSSLLDLGHDLAKGLIPQEEIFAKNGNRYTELLDQYYKLKNIISELEDKEAVPTHKLN